MIRIIYAMIHSSAGCLVCLLNRKKQIKREFILYSEGNTPIITAGLITLPSGFLIPGKANPNLSDYGQVREKV